jgi:outer membrane protein, heavy metal efflux system
MPSLRADLLKKTSYIFLALIAADVIHADRLRLSIADLEKMAQERSLIIKASQSDVKIAEAEVKTAGLWDNPELAAQYDYQALTPSSANNPATIDLRLSQPLQLFGQRAARTEHARASAFQAYLQSADFKRNYLLQVRLTAYKLLVLNTALLFQRAFYDNYQKLLQANAFRYKKGDISEYELKKLQVEGTRYENSIVTVEIESKKRLSDLKKALSIPPETEVELADNLKSPEPSEIQALLARAVDPENRSDLLASRNEITVAEKGLHAAEKDNLPDLAAAAQYHYEPGSALFAQNHYFGLGITVPLKIFNRNQGKREAYEHTIEKKRAGYAQDLLSARTELRAQRAAIEQYLALLVAGQERLLLGKEIYEKGRLLYTKKAANLIQLLESERSYFEMQREYFEILYNFQESLEIYLALTKTLDPSERAMK